ncbi:uncharacterized protein LOC122072146 [Macadamia integrifolia]|uniref:uncharacterized protein LOC122072146 n=1 Tax=Macadamia integrifolia TaxID=60698 RepID=UPI001C501700|nr:uncharacterized protein LOC122072146 [Macadamia integrifolia]
MAAATTITTTTDKPAPSTPRRVCFSFAAYAKNVIDHLKKCKIPISDGLSEEEFSSIESSFRFTFPPDLRSILREGLPVGPGFPNWRSSSPQQLEILMKLPIMGIDKEITRNNFWCPFWGDEPLNPKEALTMAKRFMKKAPLLVPIYRQYYIPSLPNLAGNPVFFVQGVNFHYSGCDVAGFFQNVEFRRKSNIPRPSDLSESSTMEAPAWAAKAARRIEFWSDLVESGGGGGGGGGSRRKREASKLNHFLEEMSRTLMRGGWREEEVKEMMMTTNNSMDGQDDEEKHRLVLTDTGSLAKHLRLMSLTLLRAGWTIDDVAYSLGVHPHQHEALDD